MMNRKLFTAVQWTWGAPQTLIGALIYAANRDKEHFDFNGAAATVWDREEGLSLGKFIFVPNSETVLTEHEYGHCIQSMILGPAYLLLVGVPSLMWSRVPYFINKRKKTGRSYYSPVFEKSANALSASVIKRKEAEREGSGGKTGLPT